MVSGNLCHNLISSGYTHLSTIPSLGRFGMLVAIGFVVVAGSCPVFV